MTQYLIFIQSHRSVTITECCNATKITWYADNFFCWNLAIVSTTIHHHREIQKYLLTLQQFISNFCLETSFIFFFWLNDRNAACHSIVGALFIIIIHFFSKHRYWYLFNLLKEFWYCHLDGNIIFIPDNEYRISYHIWLMKKFDSWNLMHIVKLSL